MTNSLRALDVDAAQGEFTISWADRCDSVPRQLKPINLKQSLKYSEISKGRIVGQVYQGDNLLVMQALLKQYAGKIDLIYMDPPFKTGKDFYTGRSTGKVVAYSDKFKKGEKSYWQFIWERLMIAYQLLSPRGALYLHTDYRTSSQLKLMLLELFGQDNYINEIIWSYKTGGNSQKLGFAKKHDTLHFCTKDRTLARWNQPKEKSYLSHKYGFKNIELKEDENGIFNLVGMRDVWDIAALRGNQPERVDYPTQKPVALLERVIEASSDSGDLVADFFCGSGTTGVAAKKLNRRFLMVDSGSIAIKATIKRIKQG